MHERRDEASLFDISSNLISNISRGVKQFKKWLLRFRAQPSQCTPFFLVSSQDATGIRPRSLYSAEATELHLQNSYMRLPWALELFVLTRRHGWDILIHYINGKVRRPFGSNTESTLSYIGGPVPQTELLDGQNHLKEILAGIIEKKLDRCHLHDSLPVTVLDIMLYAQQIVDDLETSGQSPVISCKAGCSYCCHTQVQIIPLEALVIFSFVKDNFSDGLMDLTREKMHHNCHMAHGRTFEGRYAVRAQTPCVFLESGRCLVYPVRPFICRAWNSLDCSACRSAYYSGNCQAEIETAPARNYVFSSARDAFSDLSGRLELKTGKLDMAHALLCCFSFADPLAHWLTGRYLFDGNSRSTGGPDAL